MNYLDPMSPQDNLLEEAKKRKARFVAEEEIEKAVYPRTAASGKRKTSKCVCYIYEGLGRVRVNKRKFHEYFSHPLQRTKILKPMYLSTMACQYNVDFYVSGGGVSGQMEACMVALARVLVKLKPSLKPILMKCKKSLNLIS